MHSMQEQTCDDLIKQEVISIAKQALYNHYPDGVRDEKEYMLIKATPVYNSSNWMVVYDIEDSLDTQVEIIVDSVTKNVMQYKDAWS